MARRAKPGMGNADGRGAELGRAASYDAVVERAAGVPRHLARLPSDATMVSHETRLHPPAPELALRVGFVQRTAVIHVEQAIAVAQAMPHPGNPGALD